ncbi:hypothetical protein CRG98_041002 [Punica granatum]|uniref:Uncharacterized protein n=1 Tax=Punica granatum TaxID=22663 RepID=A0A2I0I3J7_PUNGR|nr:hypothetical protein CRG98_041002 [Punica granatum]
MACEEVARRDLRVCRGASRSAGVSESHPPIEVAKVAGDLIGVAMGPDAALIARI